MNERERNNGFTHTGEKEVPVEASPEGIAKNCMKCDHITYTSFSDFKQCRKHGYIWIYRVAIRTTCKDWVKK